MDDSVDISPERCAALVAPECERLTFAVVRMTSARGAASAARYGLSRDATTMFAQLRTGLLAHSISGAGVAAVYRYRATADVRRDVGELQAANLVDVADDGAITATDTGRGLLAVMYGFSAECASELWGSHPDTVAQLNQIAGRVIEAAVPSGREAFRALAPPYEPAGADVALVLHHRLSVLRYHRADAHAAAWHAAGQTAQTMAELPAGAERDRIEADTNRRAGPPYASLTVAERSNFVQGLASLPG
jgi:hypothetical protein